MNTANGDGSGEKPLLYITEGVYLRIRISQLPGIFKILFMNVWIYIFISYLFSHYSRNYIGSLPYEATWLRILWKTVPSATVGDIFKRKRSSVSYLLLVSSHGSSKWETILFFNLRQGWRLFSHNFNWGKTSKCSGSWKIWICSVFVVPRVISQKASSTPLLGLNENSYSFFKEECGVGLCMCFLESNFLSRMLNHYKGLDGTVNSACDRPVDCFVLGLKPQNQGPSDCLSTFQTLFCWVLKPVNKMLLILCLLFLDCSLRLSK